MGDVRNEVPAHRLRLTGAGDVVHHHQEPVLRQALRPQLQRTAGLQFQSCRTQTPGGPQEVLDLVAAEQRHGGQALRGLDLRFEELRRPAVHPHHAKPLVCDHDARG